MKEYHGKYLNIGIGTSDLNDGYEAAVNAAKSAALSCYKGKPPTFSFVFISSKYNSQIKEVLRGINKILGQNWIGCTTDCELNSIEGCKNGSIEVLSIDSPYLHFSVSVAENYRENPIEKGKSAAIEAVDRSIIERNTFSTAQFIKSSKKSFSDIIRNPPYFILTFISGLYFKNKKPIVGLEFEFLEGIKEALGPFIPIIGASAISDTRKFIEGEGENYQFAGGKLYKDAAIVCFCVSELYFSYGSEHGYIPTNMVGRLTKVSDNRRIIEEINDKPAVEEYCSLLKLNKKDFLKKSMIYTSYSPISIFDSRGNIYPLASGATEDGNSLFTFSRVVENTMINISKYDEAKSLKAMKNVISQAKLGHENKKIGLAFIFSCAGRKNILQDKVKDVIEEMKKAHGEFPFFGFYSNGEIGGKRNQPSQYNNFTVTSLVLFDSLQIE